MSNWLLTLAATAGGGALLLWHAVSRTKYMSEEMLRTYRELLAGSRARRTRPVGEDSEPAATPAAKLNAEPPEVG
jgi:hypothetical protein